MNTKEYNQARLNHISTVLNITQDNLLKLLLDTHPETKHITRLYNPTKLIKIDGTDSGFVKSGKNIYQHISGTELYHDMCLTKEALDVLILENNMQEVL